MGSRLLIFLVILLSLLLCLSPLLLEQEQRRQHAAPLPPLSTETPQPHTGMVLQLAAPLTSYTEARSFHVEQCAGIEAVLEIPEDAPADLGVGAYLKDQDGRWFQSAWRTTLTPGTHQVYFPVTLDAAWHSEPAGIEWNAYRMQLSKSYGLYFWASDVCPTAVTISHLRAVPLDAITASASTHVPRLPRHNGMQILSLPGYDSSSGVCQTQSGKRWDVHCRPAEMPANPFDPEQIRITALLTRPDGSQSSHQGFYYQPYVLSDAGSHEAAVIREPGYFILRLRPQTAGRYHITLSTHIHGRTYQSQLPDLHVSGPDFDDYIYVDEKDPRFFAKGRHHSTQFWPLGINLRSVNDSRGHEHTPCIKTPNRGSLSYERYLERLSRAGANCVEIWMCNWNLALEWRRGWPNYFGAGYYNQANAERLDRILDMAHAKNIRVILVLNNHGQASSRVDSEWEHHPYNRRNGGFLRYAEELFTNQQALDLQARYRSYVIARYADHPAIMCWKLWTEQDLTDTGMRTRGRWRDNHILRTWHHEACDHLKDIDPYQHPVVTHWSSDYTIVDRSVAAVPSLDAVFIDAYHQRVPGHRLLGELLHLSMADPRRGLAAFKKPVLVTEFGGTPTACPLPQLEAEHLSGSWAALFSGHAGSPLLWWFEWVDQQQRWHPYRAVSRFMQGEDLRHRDGRSATLQTSSKHRLWSRAWARPGRVLGYVLDYEWGYSGTATPLISQAAISVGSRVRAGDMHIEWWDASLGHIIAEQDIKHTGGLLEIPIPDFRRHLAFKLYRH